MSSLVPYFLTSLTIPLACQSQEPCLRRDDEKQNPVTPEGFLALARNDTMRLARLLHGKENRADQVLIKVHAS